MTFPRARPAVLTLAAILAVSAAGAGSGAAADVPQGTGATAHHAPLDPRRLPLGDGKVSAAPQKGYLIQCPPTPPPPGAGGGGAPPPPPPAGAEVVGPWIDEAAGTFDLTGKAVVDGHVTWPTHRLSVRHVGSRRLISTNGLPDHPTGNFPVDPADDAFAVDPNPNRITATSVRLSLPARPRSAPGPSCVNRGIIGVLLSGAVIFSALDEQGNDAVAHETQDACAGHPQQRGLYHYHSLTPCLFDVRGRPRDGGRSAALVGYALDGFGIYGPVENGRTLTTADLDRCHGRTSPVEWNGRVVTMYHYVATMDFPYTIGCFRGTPVPLDAP